LALVSNELGTEHWTDHSTDDSFSCVDYVALVSSMLDTEYLLDPPSLNPSSGSDDVKDVDRWLAIDDIINDMNSSLSPLSPSVTIRTSDV